MGRKSKEVEITSEEKKPKKKMVKRPLFWIIILIIISASLGAYFYFTKSDSNIVKVDDENVDVSKIKLGISNEYLAFNNRTKDVLAVISKKLEKEGIKPDGIFKCMKSVSESFESSMCYRIVLKNTDVIYFVSNEDNQTDAIIYVGFLSDRKYVVDALKIITKQYVSNFDEKEFNKGINKKLLTSENLSHNEGTSYVYSHLKFDWAKDSEGKKYTIRITPTEVANQEQFEETLEYKEQCNNVLRSDAYNKFSKYMGEAHTVDTYEVNPETGLVDIKIEYEKAQLTKYVCASDTQYMAKYLAGSDIIGSLQFECINDSGTFYYVKVENINSITSAEVNDNTKYFNTNYNQEDTNLDALKTQDIIDYKNSCVTYNYKDVLRNPDDYKGKKAYWFGEVLQVVDKSSLSATYRVGVSCTKYQYISGYSCPDAIYVIYTGSESFIEDDMIKLYGTMDGTKTYTTVLGASVTIPKFTAKYIDLQ